MHPLVELVDWRRRVAELYSNIRIEPDHERAWLHWRSRRDALFASHPQSPLPPSQRQIFSGLRYFPHDPRFRTLGRVDGIDPRALELSDADGRLVSFTRFATVTFDLFDRSWTLELYWLEAYGGGIFLPFSDATSGAQTYGGGRYLLDTVKGADLGTEGHRLVLDFNFAYNPSCSYDPRWSCPLSPPSNRLDIDVGAGEMTPRP